MKFVSVAAVLATLVSAQQSGSGSVNINGQEIQYTGTGSGTSNIGTKDGYTSGTAAGSGNAVVNAPGIGNVKIEGAAMGEFGYNQDFSNAYVAGAVNGRANGATATGGKTGTAEGAAMGAAYLKNGIVDVVGAINGRASGDGYSIEGAAQGTAKGDVNKIREDAQNYMNGQFTTTGFISAAGVYNVCYVVPGGQRTCQVGGTPIYYNLVNGVWYTQAGQSVVYDAGCNCFIYGPGIGGGPSGPSGPGKTNTTTNTTKPLNPIPVEPTSDANGLLVSGFLSAVAGLLAFLA